MKIKHIYDPIFRQNYYYLCATSHEIFRKAVKKQLNIVLDEKSGTNGRTVEFQSGGMFSILIWTKLKKPAIIAHEVMHAVYMGLERKGIALNDSTDEVFAYLAEFLTKEIFN